MLNRLMSFFGVGDAPAESKAHGDALAVAALLVEAARADEKYTDKEKGMIDRALQQAFGVGKGECSRVRAEAEKLQTDAADIYTFTKRAKTLPEQQRISVIESIWRVVLSDQTRGAYEDTLVRRVAGLLNVEDVESGLARQRVEAEMKK